MAYCPNKNLKEYKDLVAIQGENKAYFLWDQYDGKVPSYYYDSPISNERYEESAATSSQQEYISPFELRNYESGLYTRDLLKSGEKTVTIRQNKVQPGLYKYGTDYIQVSSRNENKPVNISTQVDKESLQKKLAGENAIQHDTAKDFFAGKIDSYVYDIKFVPASEVSNMSLPIEGILKPQKSNKEIRLTHIPLFDHYIKTFYTKKAALLNELKGVRAPEKRLHIEKEILKLESAINKVADHKTMQELLNVAAVQLKDLRNQLETNSELYQYVEGIRILAAYNDINQYYNMDIDDTMTDGLKALIENAKVIQTESKLLHDKYIDAIKESIKNHASNLISPEKVNSLFDGVSDNGPMGSNFLSINFSEDAMDQYVAAIIRDNGNLINQDFSEFEKLLYNKLNEVGEDDIDFIFKNGKLITKYNSAFYDEYNQKNAEAKSGELKWNDYFKWERTVLDYELTEDGKAAFEEFKNELKNFHTEINEDGEEVFDKDRYESELSDYDPEVFQKYLDGKLKKPNKYGNRFFVRTPNVALSIDYLELQNNPKKLAFYEFFVDEFAKANENIPKDYKFGEFDKDKLANDFYINGSPKGLEIFKHAGNKIGDWFADLATIKYSESTKTKDIKSPITGNIMNQVEFKDIAKFNDAHIIQPNPLAVFKAFKLTSLGYKYKTQTETLLNMVNDLSKQRNKLNKTADDKTITDTFNDAFTSNNNTKRTDRLDFTIESYLTEVYKDAIGTASGNPTKGKRTFSFEQLGDGFNQITRLRNMALAPMSAIGNINAGISGNFMYAAGREHMDTKSLFKAMWMMKSAVAKFWSKGKIQLDDKSKIIPLIMERWNVLGDVTEQSLYGKSFFDRLFVLHSSGEFLNQGSAALAQLLYEKVKLKDGTETPLFNLFSLKNDSLEIDYHKLPDDSPYHDIKQFDKFFDRVKAVNDKIHGDYRLTKMVKRTVTGRMMMVFRDWVPMLLKERFGKRYEHDILGTQEGRLRALYSLLYDKDRKFQGKEGAKNIGKLLFKLFIPMMRDTMQFEMLDDVEQRNMSRNIREMQIMITLSVLAHIMVGAFGDDDDKETPAFHKYVYNQLIRFDSELWFFYSPKDYTQIAKDFIPAMSTFSQFWNLGIESRNYITDPDKREYQRGFRKGQSKVWVEFQKSIPVVKQIDGLFGSFSQMYSDNTSKIRKNK